MGRIIPLLFFIVGGLHLVYASDVGEYKQIHTKADCCRYNGAKVPWYGTTWVTDNGYADTPAYCQYICDWSPGCLYYSHSTRWKNCVLCSKCDFVTKNNGWRYTSWERVK